MNASWFPSPVTAAQRSIFDMAELDDYEKTILANPKATELEASEFFARFPKFLLRGSGEKLEREVQL